MHGDAPALWLRVHFEARLVEHVEHGRVVRQRHRFEACESVRCGEHGKPFQQHGAKAFALKLIVDRERDFRDGGIDPEVRADGDRSERAVDLADCQQRGGLRRVRGCAERVEERVRRLGGAEEAAAERIELEPVEEACELVVIARDREAELHDGTVA